MKTKHFEIITGKRPVLFSAPHAFLHKRPKLSMAYRQGEEYTDDIVKELCAITGAWGIFLSGSIDYDPNYYNIERNEYKREVEKLCKENQIVQFVDIHGMADGSDFDFTIFYPMRFQKSKAFAELVRGNISKGKLSDVNTALFRFLDDKEETLGEFVAEKMRIPAIQIEISKYLRQEEELRECFVKNLADVIIKKFI